MLRLFTTWFPCDNEHRRGELTTALERNLQCREIDEVCLLREGQAELPIQSPKLTIREIDQRPLFADFFSWIAKVQGRDDIAVVANADISLDETIGLAHAYLEHNQCWALGRWHLWDKDSEHEIFDRNDSQDAWTFRGPLKNFPNEYPLGGIRSDNRLLHELQFAGYEVLNPAFSVTCRHEHDEPPRVYTPEAYVDCVEGPYAYIWPHNLLSLSETRRHNARSPIKIRWRLDPRRIERSLPMRAWAFVRRGFKRSTTS